MIAVPIAAAIVAAASAAASPPAAADKMICKSHLETGSLVARKKTCLTKAQWRYLNQANEDAAHRLVEDGQSRPEGNPGGPLSPY